MYEDKLDGRSEGTEYDRLATVWKEKGARIRMDIEAHDRADRAYLDAGAKLIELAQAADSMYLGVWRDIAEQDREAGPIMPEGPRYTRRMKPSPIPKRLETKVARVARRLRKSRRLVLEEAIDEYVARHDPEAVTNAMNRVVDGIDSRPDPAIATAARSILERTEW